MVPGLVLGYILAIKCSSLCLVATVPLEVPGEVDPLLMVLHVHLPLVVEGVAADIPVSSGAGLAKPTGIGMIGTMALWLD